MGILEDFGRKADHDLQLTSTDIIFEFLDYEEKKTVNTPKWLRLFPLFEKKQFLNQIQPTHRTA